MSVELQRVTTHRSKSLAPEPLTSTHSNADDAPPEASQASGPPLGEAASHTAAAGQDGAEQGASQEGDTEFPTMTKLQLKLTLFSLSAVGFLANLDTLIVATAMPTIASQFNSLNQQSWLALSYLLTSTVFQPLFGRATDLIGSRSVLFASVFVFEFGSLLCAVSQNFIWLCAARAVAGIGGAGIMVVIMVIVSQVVPLRERGNYMGIMYARLLLAVVLGPLFGGIFASFDWRWCFWINLIIAVPAVAILVTFAKKLPHTVKPDMSWLDIDFGGMLLLGVSVVSVCLAFNWGGTAYAWNSKIVIALLVVGFTLVPLFVAWEIKVPRYPLIPMTMFRFRNVTTSAANNFFTASALQGVFIYLPSYYQLVRHDKQIISGLEVLPFIVPMLVTSTIAGKLMARTGSVRSVMWIGGIFTLLGTGLLIMLNGRHTRAVEYVLVALTGMGAGFLIQTPTLSAQSQVTRDLLATVTTMSMWSRSLGAIIGVAMQGSIITNSFKRSLLASAAAAPYITQLLEVDNVSSLPANVQSIAALAYGSAFQMMMVGTTAFCAAGLSVSLIAKNQKLS